MRPVSGSTANWMLEPPVSTPISRMTAKRGVAHHLVLLVGERHGAGATVIESPVCTPIGSKFSMEQMTTHLSLWSRITSISYSFQPSRRFLDEDLVDRREVEAVGDDALELLAVVGDAAAGAAEGEATGG
jgi:hypothetical protein